MPVPQRNALVGSGTDRVATRVPVNCWVGPLPETKLNEIGSVNVSTPRFSVIVTKAAD